MSAPAWYVRLTILDILCGAGNPSSLFPAGSSSSVRPEGMRTGARRWRGGTTEAATGSGFFLILLLGLASGACAAALVAPLAPGVDAPVGVFQRTCAAKLGATLMGRKTASLWRCRLMTAYLDARTILLAAAAKQAEEDKEAMTSKERQRPLRDSGQGQGDQICRSQKARIFGQKREKKRFFAFLHVSGLV